MKKTIAIISLCLLPTFLSANYKIIINNQNVQIPEKKLVVETCQSLDTNQPSGFYTFEANNKNYETYCYNNNGEFWTLIGYYNTLSNFTPKENITTLNTEGYLSREIWDIIKYQMSDLIFSPLSPDSSRAAKLSKNSLENANCHAFDYFDNNVTERSRIIHNENLDCLVMGSDYTIFDLNHPHVENNVGFWNLSDNVKFEPIGNFFSGTTAYENVEFYNNDYFFIK